MFIQRNSAAVANVQYIYFVMKMWSCMYEVNVQSISLWWKQTQYTLLRQSLTSCQYPQCDQTGPGLLWLTTESPSMSQRPVIWTDFISWTMFFSDSSFSVDDLNRDALMHREFMLSNQLFTESRNHELKEENIVEELYQTLWQNLNR